MKKIILSMAMISAVAFASCSDSDNTPEEESKCKVCTLAIISTEVCDNGDGTLTVKVNGTEQTVTAEYSDYVKALELAGATCK